MGKGLVHVFTGDGKGKTTSAVGLSVRARSRGLRVLFVQFMKQVKGGETDLLEKISVKVMRFEKVLSPYFHPDVDMNSLRKEALRSLELLKPMLSDYDLIVLDEFNNLLSLKLVTADEAVELISGRPEPLELVLTGRGAPDWLVELADHVVEMIPVKHPSSKGIGAREGIEY
jgi:cob(I)alamin adenosyltransferase